MRVIPVKLEGEESNDSPEGGASGGNRNTLKRPSASPPGTGASPRKRTQEDNPKSPTESMNKKEEKRDKRKLRRSNASKDLQDGHKSRRRSRADEHDANNDKKDNSDKCSNEKRRKGKEPKEKEKNKKKQDKTPRRSRPEGSKYEEFQEINIPVTIEKGNAPDKVYHPVAKTEPKVYDIKITRDGQDIPKDEEKIDKNDKTPKNKDKKRRVVHIRRESETSTNEQKHEIDEHNDKENTPPIITISPEINNPDNLMNVPINLKPVSNQPISNNDTSLKENSPSTESKTYFFGEDLVGRNNNEKIGQANLNESLVNSHADEVYTLMTDDLPDKKCYNLEQNNDDKDMKNTPKNLPNNVPEKSPEPANKKFMYGDGQVPQKNVSKNYEIEPKKHNKKKSLDASKKKSPLHSPGSKEIKVEKRQSLQENDMFKDCWKDFSSTLQDVLSRLQELSSELGQSKLLIKDHEDSSSVEKGSDDMSSAQSTCSESTSEVNMFFIEGLIELTLM